MLFTEIAIALVIAAALGFIAHLLRQPTIIGFIVAGLIIGSLGQFQLGDPEVLEYMASIGITLLLFIVGLEMNFREIKEVGAPAILTGLGQIIFTFGIGYWILSVLGFAPLVAIYIAIALTFSSTIIIIKLLSEKKELATLHGRIVLGFLLVQDFVAIMILVFLAGLQVGEAVGLSLVLALAKSAVLIGLTIFLSRLLPKVLDFIGSSSEMLFLFSVAWSLGIAAFAASPLVGLSIEIGGFLAGLALANSSEHFQIAARLRPLRDFFLILFFIGLGGKMAVGLGSVALSQAALLSVFILVGNPLVVLFVMGLLGYRSRTSFLSSLTVAQISEFSLIVMAVGWRLGHVSLADVSLVTTVGIITIFVSSYLIIYSGYLYKIFKRPLRFFEFRKNLREEVSLAADLSDHIVLIGAHRLGQNILRALSGAKQNFVVVDYDPEIVQKLKDKKIEVFYGDAADEDIQELAGLERAKVIIAAIPAFNDNAAVLFAARRLNPKAKVVLTADSEWAAKEFYRLGADYVILPHFLGGEHLAGAILKDHHFADLAQMKSRDLSLLYASD